VQDYYAVLGVAPSATLQEIKGAYRRLARLHHPDLNKEARDDLIKRLNEANEVLRNADSRSAYDAQFAQARQSAAKSPPQSSSQLLQEEREPEMTWIEGIVGFVTELKKGLRDD
jgi:curved DNA-binding protein CbpA